MYCLSFVIDDELFAVSVINVCCVVEATQLLIKSSVPPTLRRAIRLQDFLVPVIDLGASFGSSPIEIDGMTSIIVLDLIRYGRRHLLGVVVDSVCKVLQLPTANIDPPVISDSKIRNDFTLGRVSVDKLTFTFLDVERGFTTNDFFLLNSPVQTTMQQTSRFRPSHAPRSKSPPRD